MLWARPGGCVGDLSPVEAGNRYLEAELHSQALHSSQTLNLGPAAITLNGDSSWVHFRGASHSLAWGLAGPPQLRVWLMLSQAPDRSGVQAHGHSQPGVGAGAMPLRASLSPGPLLPPETQTPWASALTLPIHRGTYAAIAGRDRDPFFRAVCVIQHVYLIFCRQGRVGHCSGAEAQGKGGPEPQPR